MKKYIKSSRENSPKKYIYDICDYLGYKPPRFTDPAAGGYRVRYFHDTEDDAVETVADIERAAKELGIPIVRSLVKKGNHGPNHGYFSYVVVPRYNGQDEITSASYTRTDNKPSRDELFDAMVKVWKDPKLDHLYSAAHIADYLYNKYGWNVTITDVTNLWDEVEEACS